MDSQQVTLSTTIKSLGLVFGDIGTSPIYTLAVIFLLTERTEAHFIGILSLIIWTLVLLVTMGYAWLAMSLSKGGEGGTIVLLSILRPLLKSTKKIGVASVMAFVGGSLLIGDGVITPAISILSAVEGLTLVPGLEDTPKGIIVGLALSLTVVLFAVQRRGSGAVSGVFGPIMAVWFGTLALSGCASIVQTPQVLKALNPWYAVEFMLHNGFASFFVLSEVILCATGGEALYADMGHMGRKPIIAAWCIVLVALVASYMGQTSFLIRNPGAENVLFEMINSQAQFLYVPFLVLCLIATVIASQALISGLFSIMYQCMATHIMPLFKVDYTSKEMHSQIYINSVNWGLFVAVVCAICGFGESHKLAAAYGLAVTGTMTITGTFMVWIFHLQGRNIKAVFAAIIWVLDFTYLLANLYKFPHGGYWSILISLIPLSVILIYTQGQKAAYQRMRPMGKEQFLKKFTEEKAHGHTIRGTAIFFLRSLDKVSPYIAKTMFSNGIIYEQNIMLCMSRTYEPTGVVWRFAEDPAEGIRVFEVSAGYMEVVDIDHIMNEAGIKARVIFYGVEDILTTSPVWRIYAVIKKMAPSFVQFYKMPIHAVHGVISRIDM